MGARQSSSPGGTPTCWCLRHGAAARPLPQEEAPGASGAAGSREDTGPRVRHRSTDLSSKQTELARRRLRKLQELDQTTRVPFIMVELRGHCGSDGFVEICGKDEYGVYQALDDWLTTNWGCTKLDAGDESMDTKIPFCKAQYEWKGFHVTGDDGLNNMGLMTMRLIDFVAGQLSWTLAVVNGGNVGRKGEVRETQVIFKAPHPMNLVAPHMMIELRSAGFVEINADLEEGHREVLGALDAFFSARFKAELLDGFEDYCDRYYKAGDGVFRGDGGSLESNFGLLATQVCDSVVQLPGWSLVAANSGNYGENGEHAEQQLVFRRDEHPLGDKPYIMVVLNSRGDIELNGMERRGVFSKLGSWLQKSWGCERAGHFQEGDVYNRRYSWQAKDLMEATAEVIKFFEMEGWEIQVCSQQMIWEEGQQCREQQLLFRPGATEVGTIEPHLLVELYAGEGDEALYEDEEATQVLANQHIRLCRIGPGRCQVLDDACKALEDFIIHYLAGAPSNDQDKYHCNVFLCRGKFENNLAQWTMRLCDFMVDRLGWSFLVCSLCNMGECGQNRAQQLLFRYDGDKRDVPISKAFNGNESSAEWENAPSPAHWQDPEVVAGRAMHKVLTCTPDEKDALQKMLDSSFKRVLTRDRQPDDDAPEDEEMPYRLEVVHAFRSEHKALYTRFERKRLESPVEESYPVKTSSPSTVLTERLAPGEAYLFHGTNPSSAMSILKTGFVMDHAGSATGTMFGYGIYAAECSSKSDEYGRDDGGNTYPALNALLVCRAYVGRPYVVDSPGDRCEEARAQGCHSVCGDRESKVGTYREFIFFSDEQVYPEYSVIYRRQYAADKVPEALRAPTTGTTGRFWQIKVDGRWRNVPPEVNKLLLKTTKDGDATVAITLHGTEYLFDVVEKNGTNTRTGNKVALRQPMVS